MATAFYNAKHVEREHNHLCSLRNCKADVEYTTLHSKQAGDMTINLTGHKSGKRTSLRKWHEVEEDYFQPSHLQVKVTVHKRLLSDPPDTYPCYTNFYMYDLDDVPACFTLHDVDAVRHLFDRFDKTYQCIVPMIVKFFVDWIKIDALRKKKSATAIQSQMLKVIYSPDSPFHRSQTRSNAQWIMQAREH